MSRLCFQYILLLNLGQNLQEHLDTVFSQTFTERHFNEIAKLLECRIGIYDHGSLTKYGDWSADDGTLTILLSKISDNEYLPVSNL